MKKAEMIAILAAATLMHDDPELAGWRAMNADDHELLIIDYRDEFASSPFDLLAEAKIMDGIIDRIEEILNTIDLS